MSLCSGNGGNYTMIPAVKKFLQQQVIPKYSVNVGPNASHYNYDTLIVGTNTINTINKGKSIENKPLSSEFNDTKAIISSTIEKKTIDARAERAARRGAQQAQQVERCLKRKPDKTITKSITLFISAHGSEGITGTTTSTDRQTKLMDSFKELTQPISCQNENEFLGNVHISYAIGGDANTNNKMTYSDFDIDILKSAFIDLHPPSSAFAQSVDPIQSLSSSRFDIEIVKSIYNDNISREDKDYAVLFTNARMWLRFAMIEIWTKNDEYITNPVHKMGLLIIERYKLWSKFKEDNRIAFSEKIKELLLKNNVFSKNASNAIYVTSDAQKTVLDKAQLDFYIDNYELIEIPNNADTTYIKSRIEETERFFDLLYETKQNDNDKITEKFTKIFTDRYRNNTNNPKTIVIDPKINDVHPLFQHYLNDGVYQSKIYKHLKEAEDQSQNAYAVSDSQNSVSDTQNSDVTCSQPDDYSSQYTEDDHTITGNYFSYYDGKTHKNYETTPQIWTHFKCDADTNDRIYQLSPGYTEDTRTDCDYGIHILGEIINSITNASIANPVLRNLQYNQYAGVQFNVPTNQNTTNKMNEILDFFLNEATTDAQINLITTIFYKIMCNDDIRLSEILALFYAIGYNEVYIFDPACRPTSVEMGGIISDLSGQVKPASEPIATQQDLILEDFPGGKKTRRKRKSRKRKSRKTNNKSRKTNNKSRKTNNKSKKRNNKY
jgi:hypothetical protein